jgi:hypothetical protein
MILKLRNRHMNRLLEPPTIEVLFRRLIDGMGYHDAESIPTKDVFKMFEAFFNHEHNWNAANDKMLREMRNLSLPTFLVPSPEIPKEAFEYCRNLQTLEDSLTGASPADVDGVEFYRDNFDGTYTRMKGPIDIGEDSNVEVVDAAMLRNPNG